MCKEEHIMIGNFIYVDLTAERHWHLCKLFELHYVFLTRVVYFFGFYILIFISNFDDVLLREFLNLVHKISILVIGNNMQ